MRLVEEKKINYTDGDTSLLTTEPELTLIRKLDEFFPKLIEMATITLEPTSSRLLCSGTGNHFPCFLQGLPCGHR